jgi:hypothetical protein
MGVPEEQIAYPRSQIINVLRTLDELVVSLDRIGSSSSDMTELEQNAAIANFIRNHDVFRKVAQARQILSEPFPTALGPDGMEDLEREMQDVRYWNWNDR